MNIMPKYFFAVFILFVVFGGLIFALSGNRSTPGSGDRMLVSASFYPLAFLAQEIGGNKVDVFTVTKTGTEPHDYEPTAQDIVRITESRILLLNGARLEPWKDNILRIANKETTTVVIMSEWMEETNDPHFWLSPKLMKTMAEKVSKAMQEADTKNASYYSENESALQEKLTALDKDFTEGFSSCGKRDIVTSHDAFGYLARAYGLRQIPIAGLSPDAEPSPKTLADISVFVRKNGIQYIFFESLTSPKLSETLAKETGAKTLVLNPLEGLTKDELSAGKNYISEMRNNLTNLQIALECT